MLAVWFFYINFVILERRSAILNKGTINIRIFFSEKVRIFYK